MLGGALQLPVREMRAHVLEHLCGVPLHRWLIQLPDFANARVDILNEPRRTLAADLLQRVTSAQADQLVGAVQAGKQFARPQTVIRDHRDDFRCPAERVAVSSSKHVRERCIHPHRGSHARARFCMRAASAASRCVFRVHIEWKDFEALYREDEAFGGLPGAFPVRPRRVCSRWSARHGRRLRTHGLQATPVISLDITCARAVRSRRYGATIRDRESAEGWPPSIIKGGQRETRCAVTRDRQRHGWNVCSERSGCTASAATGMRGGRQYAGRNDGVRTGVEQQGGRVRSALCDRLSASGVEWRCAGRASAPPGRVGRDWVLVLRRKACDRTQGSDQF
jgi:hypothetical protein